MSKNVIFCYSDSFNCLDIAKNIAKRLGDTDIVMMRAEPEVKDVRGAKRVGFVFPCYAGGLPGDVEKFVSTLRVGGVTVRGNELRTILGLRSPSFTVEVSGDTLTFHVTGYGHGVGMSQYGANAMAKEGYTCEEILEHYFTGAQVVQYAG